MFKTKGNEMVLRLMSWKWDGNNYQEEQEWKCVWCNDLWLLMHCNGKLELDKPLEDVFDVGVYGCLMHELILVISKKGVTWTMFICK